MGAGDARQVGRRHVAQAAPCLDAGLAHHALGAGVGQDVALAGLGPVALGRRRHLVEAVGDLAGIADRPVAGDGPGRGGPDHDAGVGQVGGAGQGDRELGPDLVGDVVAVLDLGLGQGGLLDHRPHDRLRAAIEHAVGGELQKLGGNGRLGGEGHGGVGIVPVAADAEALELLALHADPVRGELPALAAELDRRHLVLVQALGAIALLDLPFDRQAVTVPARHVVGVLAEHLLRAVDDVLQHLVQGVAHVQVAVRIGRAVVQDELLAPGRGLALALEQVHLLPAGQDGGLALGQAGAHGKVGARQEDSRSIVNAHDGDTSERQDTAERDDGARREGGLAARGAAPRKARGRILFRPWQSGSGVASPWRRTLASGPDRVKKRGEKEGAFKAPQPDRPSVSATGAMKGLAGQLASQVS